ncbi:hypothetical protein HYU95_03220 [Candidatus Daviesbacteria bacterium]|nr:hypothetical protein [Candidatus Daviesbacteria bacterium]
MSADRIETGQAVIRTITAVATLAGGYISLLPNIADALAENRSAAHTVFLPNVQNNAKPDKLTATPSTTPAGKATPSATETQPSPVEKPTNTNTPEPTATPSLTPTWPSPIERPTLTPSPEVTVIVSTPIINRSPVPTIISFPTAYTTRVALTPSITPVTNTNEINGTPFPGTPVTNTNEINGTPVPITPARP